ncbi:hypothetical protein ACFL2Q_03900 [Thermodesulfobacteriota bacterium]
MRSTVMESPSATPAQVPSQAQQGRGRARDRIRRRVAVAVVDERMGIGDLKILHKLLDLMS